MLSKILSFILEYWRELIVLISLLFHLVLCIIKKKPIKIVETVKGAVADILPQFISFAESQYPNGHGSIKLDMVIDMVKDWFSMNHLEFTDFYKKYVVFQVKQILKTPEATKKED